MSSKKKIPLKLDGTPSKAIGGQAIGRPPTIIDEAKLKFLCEIQCTEAEIVAYLDTTESSLLRWCKRKYNKTFAELKQQYSKGGTIGIKRQLFKRMYNSDKILEHVANRYIGPIKKDDENKDTKPIVLKYSLDDVKKQVGQNLLKEIELEIPDDSEDE